MRRPLATLKRERLTVDDKRMRWLRTESILKGLFVGLCALAWTRTTTSGDVARVAVCVAAGLAAALGMAAARKLGQGYRGRWPAFLLLLVLESPGLVYGGVLVGVGAGVAWLGVGDGQQLLTLLGGGVLLGAIIWLARDVRQHWLRFAASLAPACLLAAAAFSWLDRHPAVVEDAATRAWLAAELLLAIPLFYLLTFAGRSEESEADIGVICAALGLALWLFLRENVEARWLAVLVPLALYYIDTEFILPRLRVFKHAVRGMSFTKVGRYRPALESYRRALQLAPGNRLARAGLWRLHRAMDVQEIGRDPQTLALVDFEMCMQRASSLLLEPAPDALKLDEAEHLLDLVVSQRPALEPAVLYWRAVARTHARRYEDAAANLERLLDPSGWAAGDPARAGILLSAWQLALILHPEMNRRVGAKQIELPGRRIEAIAAVERRLAAEPEDAAAWDVKRLVYSSLQEADYAQAAGDSGVLSHFDHEYVRQLGLALIGDAARWQRGAEYLRMAARGLPAVAPTIYHQLAEAYERAGDRGQAWRCYEMVKKSGVQVGFMTLDDANRQTFFADVRLLAEDARARGDLDQAIEDYRLLTESERSGMETVRTLAALYEQKGDVIVALRATEQGLIYNARDKDLLERKDRYYFSLTPEDVRTRMDALQSFFDVGYCLTKARSLLDLKNADLDLIAWAEHLARLALVVKPESLAGRMILARTLRRRGDLPGAQAALEEIYRSKPDGSDAEEDAWYLACRLLGEMYLYDLGKPDLALPCLASYRKCAKSGADTLYKMGQAYEQLGDLPRARKCYENVSAYDGHPLIPDAREALYRLQSH